MNENITASYFLCLLVLAVFTKMMSTVKDDIIKPVFLRNINSNEMLRFFLLKKHFQRLRLGIMTSVFFNAKAKNQFYLI